MDQSENAETQNWKTLALHSGGFPTLHHRRHFHKAFSGVFLTLLAIGFTSNVFAQGRFLLVLGASNNEVLRTDSAVEIHLKSWDADKFAEAIVMVAAREVLQRDDLTKIAHQSVSFAQSTISVNRLEENR